MPKRENYITWDEYFMGIALLSAYRSKDPGTQVGACIVNAQNRIMSVGYNGLPTGLSDDEFPWGKEGPPLETKYPYVCHAELNAILNSGGRSLEGCKIYVALFPCCDCAKAIIQCGIREVLYLSNKHSGEPSYQASQRMLEAANVKITSLQLPRTELVIHFDPAKI
jgi:dCMP deaminase